MQIQSEIFNYIAELIGVDVTPQLPLGNGYALQIAPSSPDRIFFNRSAESNLTVLLLGKNTNQLTVADSLYAICNNLRKQAKFDCGIYAISIDTEPSLVTKDGDYFIWSCIITAKYNIGGNK